MCIERCTHGSEGGVGVFCSQMPHAYPTGDRAAGSVSEANRAVRRRRLAQHVMRSASGFHHDFESLADDRFDLLIGHHDGDGASLGR